VTRDSRIGTRHLLGLLGLAAVLSCADSTEPTGDIEIRIANESSFAFESVDVVFPEDSVDYGPVPSHGLSEYRRVQRAYSYALIIVQVGGEELRIQPIDYVGTPLLEAGRYTYALNLTIEGQLTLATRNDSQVGQITR
jgi:hypothetical protein